MYHAFLVRNWLGRQASFKVHCDKSDLTINICLHRSDDLEGSSVGFYSSPDATVKEPPTEESRIFTYHHAVGRMLLHDGTKWHKTDDSTRGTRGSIIIWARFVSTTPVCIMECVGGSNLAIFTGLDHRQIASA